MATVEKYKQLNNIAFELLDKVDITKITIIKQFELKQYIIPIKASLVELKEQLVDIKEIEEIEDLYKSLVEIEDSTSEDEVRNSPAINKTRRFLESIRDASNKITTTINTYNNGTALIYDMTKYYNNIAEWCDAIQLPF